MPEVQGERDPSSAAFGRLGLWGDWLTKQEAPPNPWTGSDRLSFVSKENPTSSSPPLWKEAPMLSFHGPL